MPVLNDHGTLSAYLAEDPSGSTSILVQAVDNGGLYSAKGSNVSEPLLYLVAGGHAARAGEAHHEAVVVLRVRQIANHGVDASRVDAAAGISAPHRLRNS